MNGIKEFFQKEITQKALILIGFAIVLYLMESMLDLFLLTFLFTYLINSLQNYLSKCVSKYLKVNINHILFSIIIYLFFIALVVFAVYKYVPVFINQSMDIINQLTNFKVNTAEYKMLDYFTPLVEKVDIKGYLMSGANHIIGVATNIGKWSFNIFASLMLSMFFMFEKPKIKEFITKFENSRVSTITKHLKYFGRNFLNSFGKVIQAQILIAIVNSILSVIMLSIMDFPQLLGLGVMIFIFSLVPVAGAIISLIPLSIIAFNVGGLIKVVYVIVMIALMHALESYILNPKFMSAKTDLPVFFIFIILIASEHFMGVWGLLLGIPLFMFILDLLNVESY